MVSAEPALASARDAQGVSALMRARYRSDPALVDAVMSAGSRARRVRCGIRPGDVDRLRQLLDADPSLALAFSGDGFTALHFPAFFGGVEPARLLLERGADRRCAGTGLDDRARRSTPRLPGGTQTWHASSWMRAPTRTRGRRAAGPRSIPRRTTATLELVELLLARGADPAAANDDGMTVLSMAEEGGNADVVARVRAALGS